MDRNSDRPDFLDGEKGPIHEITLIFSGRSQAEIGRISSALHARAREHPGLVGMFVARVKGDRKQEGPE